MSESIKTHWEKVYQNKNPNEVSWTQETPTTSLKLIQSFQLNTSAQIIDVGGGDSKLVDHLLDCGFENITVLDISEKALEKAQKRLGNRAKQVNWIACDITNFKPEHSFDLWHDRAAFHFLTSKEQIKKYCRLATSSVNKYLVIGSFSNDGPVKCSGLEIKQYDSAALSNAFSSGFKTIQSLTEDHVTPFKTRQNFIFSSFEKK